MRIRTESPGDYRVVAEVIRRAFGGEGEVTLVDELRREPDFLPELSLVAESNSPLPGEIAIDSTIQSDDAADRDAGGFVVGHIFFSPILIDQTPGLALAPVAVLPEWQRQGVGSALVCAGLQAAAALGHALVVVVGHPEYYPRFGFVPARAAGLEVPFPVSDAAFMVCELTPGALQTARGMVHYAAPFGKV